MLPVEPRGGDGGQEELRTVRVLPSVGHLYTKEGNKYEIDVELKLETIDYRSEDGRFPVCES